MINYFQNKYYAILKNAIEKYDKDIELQEIKNRVSILELEIKKIKSETKQQIF